MRARFAALAALVAVAAAIFTLVSAKGGGSTAARVTPAQAPVSRSRHHYWYVRNGQTLSLIATRTRVSTDTIKSLNPNRDLAVLHSGDRVRVRP